MYTLGHESWLHCNEPKELPDLYTRIQTFSQNETVLGIGITGSRANDERTFGLSSVMDRTHHVWCLESYNRKLWQHPQRGYCLHRPFTDDSNHLSLHSCRLVPIHLFVQRLLRHTTPCDESAHRREVPPSYRHLELAQGVVEHQPVVRCSWNDSDRSICKQPYTNHDSGAGSLLLGKHAR